MRLRIYINNLLERWVRAAVYIVLSVLSIEVRADPSPGLPVAVSYTSSSDGTPLYYNEYLPNGFDQNATYKLAILLPGSGGNISQYDIKASWRAEADARGYILATVQPRFLAEYNARSTFYLNGPVAPGEQDVLDVIPVLKNRYRIDPNRIYLAGYSMGGYGTLNIASLNPGIFAAIAPGAPISDMFQELTTGVSITPDFVTLLGGAPGSTAGIDTIWYKNSPRFLIYNLMNTPVKILHGTADTFIPNSLSVASYMHTRHIVDVPGYSDSRGDAMTLQELATAWPGRFIEEHSFPLTDHGVTSLSWVPSEILAFFDSHIRSDNPESVALSTYDDTHSKAHWLKLELLHPNTAVVGTVIVTRDIGSNHLSILSDGEVNVTLDLAAMGLSTGSPILVDVYPNSAGGEIGLALDGPWSGDVLYSVSKDGVKLPNNTFSVVSNRFTLASQENTSHHSYAFTVSQESPTPTAAPQITSTPVLTPTHLPTPASTQAPVATPTPALLPPMLDSVRLSSTSIVRSKSLSVVVRFRRSRPTKVQVLFGFKRSAISLNLKCVDGSWKGKIKGSAFKKGARYSVGVRYESHGVWTKSPSGKTIVAR